MLQTSPQPDRSMRFLKHSLQTLLGCKPLWQGILCLSTLVIIYLATTSEPHPIPSSASDKVNHFIAFLQLTIVTRLAWPELSRYWVALGVMSFGLGIEITQSQLPYRDFSLLDLAADAVGTGIGLLPFAPLFDAGKRARQT
ncbi:VanZ family protein [Marinobacter sp. CHS3-4]|uniref:VanZ family protein n=1 Tax=Marinobacter sp. CHS3-4 TaxID=3045174 RepID=UPI0024B5B135|nr:VanZ family protein [Marinobacter sp. CHS3-4]MDI9244070.1 VanZ family protein [Marinobacter sp. CHS3-4]